MVTFSGITPVPFQSPSKVLGFHFVSAIIIIFWLVNRDFVAFMMFFLRYVPAQ
jgi:hypothetical protein